MLAAAFFYLAACQDSEEPQPTEFGYLLMQVMLSITSEEANGRVEAVNTDNFRVTIFDASGTEILVFDPFSTAPPEVALPTGEYYVEAHSNNLVDAAFDNPYYFGRSANFTIDKEETTSIDINTELANTKVAILYSDDVVNTFDSYTGTVTVISTDSSLFYAQGETREGYFVTSPLEVEVELSYTKLDGQTIDRIYTALIDNPEPKTLYNINVDAALEDGTIVFNITVDESFDAIDIGLGDITVGNQCDFSGYRMEVLGDTDVSSPTWTRGTDGLIHQIQYMEDGVNFLVDLTYNASNQLTRIQSDYTRADLTYDASGRLIREDAFDYDFDNNIWQDDGVRIYEYNANGQLYRVLDLYGGYDEFVYADNVTNNPQQELGIQSTGIQTKTLTYTYDDKENVFKELGMRFWDILDTEAVLFADNNTLSILDEDFDNDGNLIYSTEIAVTYTYDEFDRPIQADFLDVDYGSTQRFTFFYEDCQ